MSLSTYKLWQRKRLYTRLAVAVVLMILAFGAAILCKVNWQVFREGIGDGLAFIGYMFPPDWQAMLEMIVPALETVLYALLATIFGAILSLVFAFAAAANIAPSWLRQTSRFLIAFERALPEIIILLLLIAALGLGPFPGVVALSIGCLGMLGRLFADAIEEIEPRTLEAIESVGATRLQTIRYGIIPQILPAIAANTVFRFEINIRLSVLLGAVGAGGIGYELYYAFQMLEYQRATAAILLILILVLCSERLSDFLRKRTLTSEKLT